MVFVMYTRQSSFVCVLNVFSSTESLNENIELYLILKKVRNEIAIKNNIPAFVIFHDKTLQDISDKMPISKEEFLSVNGVGKNKLEKYFDIFSNYIKDYKISKKLIN